MYLRKNVLSKKFFKEQIYDFFTSPYFPWYFNPHINNEGDAHFQFVYTFIRDSKPNCEEHMLKQIKPITDLLKAKKIFRIKANLTTKDYQNTLHGFHKDDVKGSDKTALFYINTNNGYTKFKTGEEIKSEANSLLTFDAELYHSSVSCTDEKCRLVINFNYT
tara:strand:- start:5 stop:490 length:486 start_codon:yes stop_codon:yes gene_type:complete